MLCVAYASVSYPCGYYETVGDEYTYMFKIYDYDECFLWNRNNIFRSNNIKFWYKYTHGNVDSTVIEKALYECSADDIDNGTNVFFVYLHKINDAEALRYWSVIKTFSAKMNDPWYYPNRAEKREISRLIEEIDGILNSRTSEQLKERYMYVLMQMLFYMKQYGTCRDIWETRKFVWNDKELELRCLLYYAGALFYSGRETEAADIYADNGEWQNFRYFDKSVAFMNKLYAASPNSKAFMFFVQNYLNQQQDKRAFNSCDDFIALCEKAVSEKKSDDPALWQSALAHIAFLRGDVNKAVELIEKASKMKGCPGVMDNIRMLRLLYHATDTADPKYSDYLYRDLPWLLQKVSSLGNMWAINGKGYDHHLNMLARIVLYNAYPHYKSIGNSNMAAILLNAYDEAYCYDREVRAILRSDTTSGSREYDTYCFRFLDKTSIENVKNFLAFVKSGGKTDLEKTLIKSGYIRESMINELIATKYMRIFDYNSAIAYLEKVHPLFWKKQNITEYLNRNPFRENWIGSDNLRCQSFTAYNALKEYDSLPSKLQFCKIMRHLEQRQNTSPDKEERAAMHYAYAVGMVRSKDWSWALTQYAKYSFYDIYQFSYYSYEHENTADDWDYKSSYSYDAQNNYLKITSHLKAAEELTTNKELAARCQYLRCVIEMDKVQKRQYYRRLVNYYGDTKFVNEESCHCATLADYR